MSLRNNARDAVLIAKLVERNGMPSIAVFEDGREAIILNIAWGYDLGSEFAHVTTNVSPFIDGVAIDFFFTNELIALLDGETRAPLFSFPI